MVNRKKRPAPATVEEKLRQVQTSLLLMQIYNANGFSTGKDDRISREELQANPERTTELLEFAKTHKRIRVYYAPFDRGKFLPISEKNGSLHALRRSLTGNYCYTVSCAINKNHNQITSILKMLNR